MKTLLVLLAFIPFFCSAQIYDHKRVFTDSLEYKDFNQGYIDAQEYFKGTRDFAIGFTGLYTLIAPAVICHISEPKDKRFLNPINPNREYLYSNADYYNGYKYSATKKKRKRIRQGFFSFIGILIFSDIIE